MSIGEFFHVVVTVLFAMVGLAYAFLPMVTSWFDAGVTRPLGLSNVAVVTVYWLLWIAFGANRVTLWLADIENGGWHSVAFGLLAVIAGIALFWSPLTMVFAYLRKNVSPWSPGLCGLGVVLLILGTFIISRRRHHVVPEPVE
jgi:hypothetical protein